MSPTDERELLYTRWAALCEACRKQHPNGAGGAAMCICGAGCGGSAACSMLREIRDLVQYMPTKGLPKTWRDKIERLQSII